MKLYKINLITIIILVSFAFSSGIVFAKDVRSINNTSREPVNSETSETQQTQDANDIIIVIRNQKAELMHAEKELRKSLGDLKSIIEELRADTSSITEEDIRKIRESIRLIRASRNLLENTIGQINIQRIQLDQQRSANDYQRYTTYIENLEIIQDRRLQAFNRLQSDINSLMRILK